MPRLFVLSGPDAGKRFDVEDGATLGRSVECAVQLRDASVSRHHARLQREGEAWRIVDAASRNGLRFRGERVESAELQDGDEVQVGEVLLRFRAEGAATASEPPVPASARIERGRAADPDEITLEEDPLEGPTTFVAPAPAPAPAPRAAGPDAPGPSSPTPPRPPRAAAAVPLPGTPLQRGQRVLQYQRIPDREGLFASDLAQQPAWVRLLVGLVALAMFAGILVLAFKATAFLKTRASGTGVEIPVEGGQ